MSAINPTRHHAHLSKDTKADTPPHVRINLKWFTSGLYAAMTSTQKDVLVCLLRYQPTIFASEATIAKGCGLNEMTVGQTLKGFALVGLFTKTRRSKGKGLQSSNSYTLCSLDDKPRIAHIVASFSHPDFNKTMKALYRGGKAAANVDQALVEQFRWKPSEATQATQSQPEPQELKPVTTEPSKPVARIEAPKAPAGQARSKLTQELCDWMANTELKGGGLHKLKKMCFDAMIDLYEDDCVHGRDCYSDEVGSFCASHYLDKICGVGLKHPVSRMDGAELYMLISNALDSDPPSDHVFQTYEDEGDEPAHVVKLPQSGTDSVLEGLSKWGAA